jgi:hypothetical protein
MTDKTTAQAGVVSSTEFGPVAWRHSKTYCLYETEEEVPLADGDEHAEPLYDAATLRALVGGAWCAGYYDAGYTNDSAYSEKKAQAFADACLLPNTPAETRQTAQKGTP